MDAKEISIYEIIDFVIGHTNVNCETNYDYDSHDNLENLNDVAIYLMKKLDDNTDYYNDNRYSANLIADKSMHIVENLKVWCDDILSKKGENHE